MKNANPELPEIALKFLLPFPSTNLCEAGSSPRALIKARHRESFYKPCTLRSILFHLPGLDRPTSHKGLLKTFHINIHGILLK